MKRRIQTGFTIIELMLSIAVLATLIGIGIPYLRDWNGNREVSLLSESIANGLRSAQTEAIKINRPVAFILTNSTWTGAAPSDPSSLALVDGGLATSDGAVNWAVRVAGSTDTKDFVVGRTSGEGWTNTRVSGAASVTFGAEGKISATTNAAGTASAAAYTVYRIVNPTLSGNGARLRCVLVTPGGAVKICDPRQPNGDARSCQPYVPTTSCPVS